MRSNLRLVSSADMFGYGPQVFLTVKVESFKELTTSLMELYHSSVGLRTNEIMRVIIARHMLDAA